MQPTQIKIQRTKEKEESRSVKRKVDEEVGKKNIKSMTE
jgi:hypothetical protein